MGSMNALGHLLCATAGGDVNELWDLAEELFGRLEGKVTLGPAPSVHGFAPSVDEEMRERMPRFCFHPTGEPHIEFRADSLPDALTRGCIYLARLLPEDELWRRD